MWSNKKIYDDVLIPEKSCNARMVSFAVSSGTTTASNFQTTQQLFFNNVQPLGAKGARNFFISGTFDIQWTHQSTAANDETQLEFVKNPLWAMSCLVSINGGVNQEVPLGPISAIFENYTDKYKAFPNRRIQNYYDYYYTAKCKNTATNTDTTQTDTIHFSVPLMHPLLMGPIGQCSSLNIRISTFPGFYCLFNKKEPTKTGTITWGDIKINISQLELTYEEFDIADGDFSNEFEYMVVYQKAYGSSQTTQSSDVRNVSSVPHDLFCLSARDGAIYGTAVSDNTAKTLPIYGLKIDLQNNINAFNAGTQQAIYSRCRANDYKGAYSDFVGGNDENNFSPVIRYPMRDAPVSIGTNDMFRSDFRDVNIGTYVNCATLYVIYSYKAILHLSLGSGQNAIEYTKNASEAFLGEIADGKDEDLIGGFSFGNIFKKVGGFLKNGGLSKVINTAQTVSDIIKPGNKFSQAMDKAGQISQAVGLSSSIF